MWLMALLRYWHTTGGNAPQLDFLVLGGKPDVLDDEVRALGGRIIYLRYGGPISSRSPVDFAGCSVMPI